jgi:hypothetical protein
MRARIFFSGSGGFSQGRAGCETRRRKIKGNRYAMGFLAPIASVQQKCAEKSFGPDQAFDLAEIVDNECHDKVAGAETALIGDKQRLLSAGGPSLGSIPDEHVFVPRDTVEKGLE